MKNMLLVLLVCVCVSDVAAQDCEIPATYLNQVTVTEGDLWIGFASDKTTYALTDTAHFYLVVKNIGTEQYYVNWLVDPPNAIHVLPLGCTEVGSSGCTICDRIYSWPWILYYYSSGVNLAPGECRVFLGGYEAVWPISKFEPIPAPGDYTIVGGLYKPSVVSDDPCGELIAPTTGALLTVTLVNTVSAEPESWGVIKSLFDE